MPSTSYHRREALPAAKSDFLKQVYDREDRYVATKQRIDV